MSNSPPTSSPTRFSDDALRQHVEKVLNQIPPDARRVCVGYARTDGTVAISYIERLGPHWTLGMLAGHAPDKGWTGEVALRGVWK